MHHLAHAPTHQHLALSVIRTLQEWMKEVGGKLRIPSGECDLWGNTYKHTVATLEMSEGTVRNIEQDAEQVSDW
jgi:hypothetical protein